jgi:hypothetical protein
VTRPIVFAGPIERQRNPASQVESSCGAACADADAAHISASAAAWMA